jgi:uncharacterized protein YbjT (DUF2867 family)
MGTMTTTEANTDILLTGGTGRTGARLAHRLEARGERVRIGSRRAPTPFDWHDPDTWTANLRGARAVYLCYSPDLAFPGALEAVTGLAQRAAESGVRRLVLLSGRGEPAARAAEEAVAGIGVEWAVLRCAWFAQNFSEHFLLGPVRRGRLLLPADAAVGEPFLDLDDLADVAADALVGTEHLGRVLELTGPRLLTMRDVVDELSAATGRRIDFEACTPDEFADDLALDGMAREESLELAALFTDILDGRNASLSPDLERALGRRATDFGAYATRTAAAGTWSPAGATGE